MTSAPSQVFWRYWTGTTVSGVGDAISAVALPLTAVLVLHASALQVGLVAAAGYAAWALFGLPAGVLVAWLPLRGTQIAMDLIRALALASIPLGAWAGVLSIGQLAAVAFTVSVANVIFDVGNSTFMPQIVAQEELTRRNSLTSASYSATSMAGPALAGVLVQAFGAATTVLFDVGSYLASALLLRTLPRPTRLPAAAASSVSAQIRQGWHYVARHPVIRPCVADATATNFVCGALLALTPVFLVRTLHTPAGLVGVVMAAEGAGSLAGAALTPRIGTRLGSARALLFASAAMPLALCLLPASFRGLGLLLFAFGNAGFAATVVVLSILTRTHRHQVVPTDLLPRVMATVRFISWGVVPLGALAAGAAAATFGPRIALWATCVVAALPAIALWSSRIRTLRELTDEVTAGSEPASVSAPS
jgi:Transmembrane secretion effector